MCSIAWQPLFLVEATKQPLFLTQEQLLVGLKGFRKSCTSPPQCMCVRMRGKERNSMGHKLCLRQCRCVYESEWELGVCVCMTESGSYVCMTESGS